MKYTGVTREPYTTYDSSDGVPIDGSIDQATADIDIKKYTQNNI